jgi:hypothetical protein
MNLQDVKNWTIELIAIQSKEVKLHNKIHELTLN